MKLFIKKTLLLILSFIFLIYCYGFIIDNVFRNGSYYKSQWINSLTNKNVDYAIIGNSRASLLSLNEKNVKYINLAEDGIGMGLTYLQLYSYYKKGNKTKYVLLQGDYKSFNKTDDSRRSPRWIPYFKDSIVYSILKNEHKSFKNFKYLPAVNYSIFKYDWGFSSIMNNFFEFKKSPWGEYGYYNVCNKYVNNGPKGSVDFDKFKQDMYWVDKLNELSRNNGSKLIIFTAPYFQMIDSVTNTQNFKNSLLEKSIIYLDFSREFENNNSLFRDNNHLNCYGVEKFSPIIVRKLKETDSTYYKHN
jgi:hypothetical protein